jgi:hypothetical protein
MSLEFLPLGMRLLPVQSSPTQVVGLYGGK